VRILHLGHADVGVHPLSKNPQPSEAEIMQASPAISCRCTGFIDRCRRRKAAEKMQGSPS
jgi:aerobic-type carbon monoxide dehydrogenase small subunit (CoxS/CutS family)